MFLNQLEAKNCLTIGLRRIFDPLATLAGLVLSALCVRRLAQMNTAAMMLMLTLFFMGCLRRGAVETTSFDAALASAKPVCEEFFLPNSMARSSEFDINVHQTELEQRIFRLADTFRSVAGIAYLEERVRREKENVDKACVRKLLGYARETA
jgi:hypothetical protein